MRSIGRTLIRLWQNYWKAFFVIGSLIVVGVAIWVVIFSVPPSDFPDRKIVEIKQGMYLSQVADILESKHIIKSTFIFKVSVVLMSGYREVQAGDYLFDHPESVLKIAYRTVNGIQGLSKIKVTLVEGLTVKAMGSIIKKNITGFDMEKFLLLAKPLEGYLFPDTYFFYENASPEQVIEMMTENHNQKMKTALLDIQALGKPVKDVVIMASIVEKEATSSVDRRIIAGILWKRIASGMALQVDPPFYYILGKDSAHLTMDDLKMNSPYNLYRNKGLPPTPISNPGIGAIIDTARPTSTKYWFYLSDKKGNMHYAATYEGHLANKRKYID